MKTHETKTTKTMFSPGKAVLLALAAVAVAVFACGSASAVGTPAGTTITNQAYVDYNDANGNSLPRVFSNIVTSIVSQVGGLNIMPAAGSNAANNNTDTMFRIEMFNVGNGSDTFDFNYSVTAGWTPTAVKFYSDSNDNHVYEAGVDPLMTAPYDTGALAADGDLDVFMMVTAPGSGIAPDTSQCEITFTAVSRFDGAVTDAGVYTTTISSAVVTGAKSYSEGHPEPGEQVTYTVTLNNTGSSSATNLVFTDVVPVNMTYVAGNITYQGAARTDAADADNSNYNVTTPGAVTVDVGTLASGASVVITFIFSVNSGVALGTFITNQGAMVYNSGPNVVNTNTNVSTVEVEALASIDLTSAATISSGDPGDQIVYAFTAHNHGNGPDIIDLTGNSNKGWTWDIWVDTNADGIPGNGGDFIITDSDADGKLDTGTLASGASINLLAEMYIPAGTLDATVESYTITGASSVTPAVTDAQAFTTTVTAPVLSITSSVNPAAPSPPGTELTYTIQVTNSGSGTATIVTMTNAIPTNTTYKPGSILTGDTLPGLTARTDASDGDGGQFDSGITAVIAGAATNITIGSGGTFFLRFTVTID